MRIEGRLSPVTSPKPSFVLMNSADQRAHDSENDGDDEPTGIAPRHQPFGDHAGNRT